MTSSVTEADAEAIRQEFSVAYLARCVYASPAVATNCDLSIKQKVPWKIQIEGPYKRRSVVYDEALRVATHVECDVASLHKGVDPANDLGKAGVVAPHAAHTELVDLMTALTERGVPATRRYVVAPPWFCGLLMRHPNYTFADRDEVGLVIRTPGVDVYESTACPSPSVGEYVITAGSPAAIEYTNAVSDRVRSRRSEVAFANVVDGEVLYGARLVWPGGIVTRTVTER